MKIRKSRLKEIISEEVNNSKFIAVREGDEPSILAPGLGDFGQDAIAVLKETRNFIDKMIEDNQVYGNLLDSAMSRLAGVAAFHKEVQPHLNDSMEATADMEPPEFDDNDNTVDVDLQETVAQEILRALAEAGGDLKGDEDEEEKRGGAIDPRTDTTKRDYVPQFEGKKDDDWMGDVKSTGEWTDYTVAELEKKKAALMKKEKRTAAEVKTVRQLNFAIRAKKGELSEKKRA
tara:strand:+ start:4945 stop:5640 length:696 start_codon:yes stop_codon:yes gene_type:complete